jgi:hypothetical protein
MLRQLYNGIRRHPLKFILAFLLSIAATWGTFEAFVSTYPELNGIGLLSVISIIALIASLFQIWSPDNITLYWNDLQLLVEIKTGDLFSIDGNVAISADDFFLTQHTKLIGQSSLMGQLVNREYKGQPELLDKDLIQFASNQNNAKTESTNISGKNKRYPIGTTVAIQAPQKRIFITALCTIDTTNQNGRASANDVWIALQGLWHTIADHPTGKPTSVPLFGTGQTSAGLSPSTALNIMLASLIVATRQKAISDKINIIIPVGALEFIDLSIIRETWSNPKK